MAHKHSFCTAHECGHRRLMKCFVHFPSNLLKKVIRSCKYITMAVRQILSCMESNWKTSPSNLSTRYFPNIWARCKPTDFWRHRPTQMGAALAHWSVFGTLSIPLWKRGTCVGSYHWASDSSVSCSLLQQFYHHAVYEGRYNPIKLVESRQTILRNVHHIRCRFGRYLVEWHTLNGSFRSALRSLCCCELINRRWCYN